MNYVFFKRSVLAGLGLVASGWSLSAQARDAVIDGNPLNPITACTLGGAACVATSMGFTANFGSGSFSGLYIYTNGLVSFGSEIAGGADLSSLASIGTNVFTAGYSPTMVLSAFRVATGLANVEYPNRPVIRINYLANVDATDHMTQIDIYDLGGGEFVLQYDYGGAGTTSDIATNAYVGYNFPGASGLQINNPRARVQAAAQPGNEDFRFFLPGAVPEPATWATMLTGFALVGIGQRRRKRTLVAAT
jgi:PEP-CTERM motif